MQDNGLLNLYKSYAKHWQRERVKSFSYNAGLNRFNISSLNIKSRLRVSPTQELLQTEFGKFYVTDHAKVKPYAEVARCADRQILLSQIYNKLGLTSAVYTPATENGERQQLENLKTISNDVTSAPLVVRADSFIKTKLPKQEPKDANEFLAQNLTPQAQLASAKMRIFDVASFVQDRTPTQFFYKLQDESENANAEDVVTIQSGNSSYLSYGTYGYPLDPLKECSFYSDVSPQKQSGEDVVTSQVEYLEQNNLISPHELAEEMGSLDPYKVASEIEDATGYKIDDAWYLESICRSYQNTAELIESLEQ